MQLLTDVTTQWMQLMVDKKYPPLTPHHTQAFTVLTMARFFGEYLGGNSVIGGPQKTSKLKSKM